MNEESLGVLIPIIAVTLGLTIPIVGSIVDYKRKRALIEAMNKERIVAIEKGVTPPTWPQELVRDIVDTEDAPRSPEAIEQKRHGQLTSGLVTLGVGVGILFGLAPLIGPETARVGFIPIAIGVAMLIAWALRGRSKSGGSTDSGAPR